MTDFVSLTLSSMAVFSIALIFITGNIGIFYFAKIVSNKNFRLLVESFNLDKLCFMLEGLGCSMFLNNTLIFLFEFSGHKYRHTTCNASFTF